MNKSSRDPDMIEKISRFVDKDLPQEERDRFLEALETDSGLGDEVRAMEAVKASIGRIRRYEAPADLMNGIVERLDQETVPVLKIDRPGRPARRWLRPALAMAAVFVAIILIQIADGSRQTAIAQENLAGEVSRGHCRCVGGRETHFQSDNPTELAEQLAGEMDGLKVQIPDLSDRGLFLVEGHRCKAVDGNTAHIYYETLGTCVSYYTITAPIPDGALGKKVGRFGRVRTLPNEFWRAQDGRRLSGVLWKRPDGCVCALVGELDQKEFIELVEECFLPLQE